MDENHNIHICVDYENGPDYYNYVYLFDGTEYTIEGESYNEGGWYIDEEGGGLTKITTIPEFGGSDFPELIVEADDTIALERANKYLSDVFVKK